MIVYQYYADGLYAGELETYGGPMPNNTTEKEPTIVPGYWPKWDSLISQWGHVEDHRGEEGFVNGALVAIKEVGPYPEKWSTEPPEKTKLSAVEKLQAEYTPEFSAIANSYLLALITKDKEGAKKAQEEYAALLDALAEKVSAI